jgi:prolyl-tRNA synthetase
LGARFIDENGEEKPFIMGSYGIGVTRTLQAAIEAFHDEKGIIWPKSLAPYDFHVIPLFMSEPRQKEVAFDIMSKLEQAGYSVISMTAMSDRG